MNKTVATLIGLVVGAGFGAALALILDGNGTKALDAEMRRYAVADKECRGKLVPAELALDQCRGIISQRPSLDSAMRDFCETSSQCQVLGACGYTPDEDRLSLLCRPTKDAHCAGTAFCKSLGHCRAVDGSCVE